MSENAELDAIYEAHAIHCVTQAYRHRGHPLRGCSLVSAAIIAYGEHVAQQRVVAELMVLSDEDDGGHVYEAVQRALADWQAREAG